MRKPNGVLQFFDIEGVKPDELAKCKYCGEIFSLRDRTGRKNYVGLNSHLSSDLWKARARGEVVP